MSDFPDFAAYFRALWGYDPFPWQSRLSDELTNREWRRWITLPTGMGKTTVLDIAVYHLAREASLPAERRTAPVRIVFAVNRRIVVDEAFERARSIAARLAVSCGYKEVSEMSEEDRIGDDRMSVLRPVGLALQRLADADGGPPLEAFPLRGATFTDHSWARTPTQPLILTTTLDQLGSRLLFRGYGVSRGARPIQAALLANDALLILDEAHTAKAFSQTLASVSAFRGDASQAIGRPFAAVQLTATPPADVTDEPFSLDLADFAHPVIRARFEANKPATLDFIEGAKGAARHGKLADAIKEKALSYLAGGHRRILVVVNRVATAESLQKKLNLVKTKEFPGTDVEILTGRLRPLDREALIRRLDDQYQLKCGNPSADVPSIILIATQCIEVGADFDFDALVTELAPIDCLRQRFGRLNRTGRRIQAPAAIIAPEEALDQSRLDPIYGESLPPVWTWLQSVLDATGNVDFGLRSMGGILPQGKDLEKMLASSLDAPILLAPHLDLFCQTSPEPHVSPDPAPYIHGPGKNFPEVFVVLRSDVEEADTAPDRLRAVPPLGTEAATLPLPLVRQWLGDPKRSSDESGDAPGINELRSSDSSNWLDGLFVWRQGEPIALSHPSSLRTADMLILPTQIDREKLETLFSLPDLLENDLDQFESATLLARDRLTIRFHRQIVEELASLIVEPDARRKFREIVDPLFAPDDETGESVSFRESAWRDALPKVASHLAANLPGNHPWSRVWTHAARLSSGNGKRLWRATPYPGKTLGVVFTCRERVGATPWPLDPDDLGRQGDAAFSPVPLARHSKAVSDRCRRNARGLGEDLEKALVDAGLWHDLGKLDPRFQALLQGCTDWSVDLDAPLAKSGSLRKKGREDRPVRWSLPFGFRHELLSARIVQDSDAATAHPEMDLLLHLIASHHGHCRAMAPVVPDAAPENIEVAMLGIMLLFKGCSCPLAHPSDGVARRFWSLTRRFGWWGLPYLEAVLRLADQYESSLHETTELQ